MKLFQLDTEAVIINEVVINEVRLRECLWNPRNACYKNKTDQNKAWEEVAVAVLPKYTTYSEDNKRRIVRAVQSRWKTARDAYMKYRLTEINKPTYRARQHRFIYNKLRFLERVKDLFEDIDEHVNNKVNAPEHSDDDNAAGTAGLAAGQVAVPPVHLTKKPPNKGVPPCVPFKDNEVGSKTFVGANSESQSTSTACDADDSEGSDEIKDFDIDIHDDFKEKIKHLVTASLPGGKASSTCGIAAGAAPLAAGQIAVRPDYLTKESPNKGVPLGKSRTSVPPAMCASCKDNEESSNSFVGDNCEIQSTSTACDADDSEGFDEIKDFDIDIYDDFKENIKHLVNAFDGIDDKTVNDNINQKRLPGTSSHNNGQKDPLAVANDVTKPQKKCTSANTATLQTDDQLFFNSLAPLIHNFGTQQKLKLRSKILEVVMEVSKIGPVNIKQESDT